MVSAPNKQFGSGPRGRFTGNSWGPEQITPPIEQRWELPIYGDLSTMVGADGVVVVAYGEDGIMAVDCATGDVLWDFPYEQCRAGNNIWLTGNCLFINSGHLFVRDVRTGSLLGELPKKSRVLDIDERGNVLVGGRTVARVSLNNLG